MPPKWAATIWADSDWLYLQLPSPICESAYVVKLPRDGTGISQAIALLSHRGEASTIGTAGSPTNYQLEMERLSKETDVKPRKPTILATPKQRSTIKSLLRKMELI